MTNGILRHVNTISCRVTASRTMLHIDIDTDLTERSIYMSVFVLLLRILLFLPLQTSNRAVTLTVGCSRGNTATLQSVMRDDGQCIYQIKMDHPKVCSLKTGTSTSAVPVTTPTVDPTKPFPSTLGSCPILNGIDLNVLKADHFVAIFSSREVDINLCGQARHCPPAQLCLYDRAIDFVPDKKSLWWEMGNKPTITYTPSTKTYQFHYEDGSKAASGVRSNTNTNTKTNTHLYTHQQR